jgi:hypothetical protein
MPRRRKKRNPEPDESESPVPRLIQTIGGVPRESDLVTGALTDMIARGYDEEEEEKGL